MGRRQYPGELTDKEWDLIRPIIEKTASPRGRKSKYGKRTMINAIFYLIRSGCSWATTSSGFPSLASSICSVHALEGCENIRAVARSCTRDITSIVKESAAAKCWDCRQSECKDNRKRGLCGYDANKKIKGRKRHIAVDTEGFLLQAYITSAMISDKQGAKHLFKSKRLRVSS